MYPPRVTASPLLVTGANGHLGRDLIRAVHEDRPIRAIVRSERAANSLDDLKEVAGDALEVRIVSYEDEAGLAEAGAGCSAWVHLVGILKETRAARYEDAHEATCRVLAAAAAQAGARRIVYVSILGSHPDAKNGCLASKGRAERILAQGSVPSTTLRVPMVLGPDEVAAGALRGQAMAPFAFLARGGATLEQPIDERDLVQAIRLAARDEGPDTHGLDLAGPESLSHADLVRRVGAVLGKSPRVLPIPLGAVTLLASLFEAVSASPPLTRDMLGVLEHDDDIDPLPTCRLLGLELTPLDDTLKHVFPPDGAHAS